MINKNTVRKKTKQILMEEKLKSPCVVRLTRLALQNQKNPNNKISQLNRIKDKSPLHKLASKDTKLLSQCVVNVVRTPVHDHLRAQKQRSCKTCDVEHSPTSSKQPLRKGGYANAQTALESPTSKPTTRKQKHSRPKNLLDVLISEQSVIHCSNIKKTDLKNKQLVPAKKAKTNITKNTARNKNIINKNTNKGKLQTNVVAVNDGKYAAVDINTEISQARSTPEVIKRNVLKHNLRNRKTHDYRESSIRNSETVVEENKDKTHIPVYLQQLKSPSPTVRSRDIYAFKPEKNENVKGKKKRTSDNEFVPKVAKNKKKGVRWQTRVKNTLASLGLDYTSKTLEQDIEKLIKTKSDKFDKNIANNAISTPVVAQQIMQNNNAPDKIKGVEVNTSQNKVDESHDSASLFHDTQTINSDPYFGFSDNETPTKSGKTQHKINVISNILLTPSRQQHEPRSSMNQSVNYSLVEPDAHSTMIASRQSGTPWRPHIPVERNPHLLWIKHNSLPNSDQKMVMDSTLDHSVPSSSTKSPVKVEQKELKQQTILNYTNQTIHLDNTVNSNEVSLFNTDEYSPIKIQEAVGTDGVENLSDNESDKENVLHKESFTQVKRNILQDQKRLESTNIEANKENNAADNIKIPSSVLSLSNQSQLILSPSKHGATFETTVENVHADVSEEALKVDTPKKKVLGEKSENIKNVQRSVKALSQRRNFRKARNVKDCVEQLSVESAENKLNKSHGISGYFGFSSFNESHQGAASLKKTKVDVLKTKKVKSEKVPVVLLINIIKHVDEKDLFFIDGYEQYNKKKSLNMDTGHASSNENESESKNTKELDNDIHLFEDYETKVSEETCSENSFLF